ncbi:hypothetical protein GH714_002197 [Hevea brasiliensis]|uniref:BHLH domain-containing protein n=1 Tax=Hevea brasiliensis TaxID=3981 RepID=A0A6A6LJ48_HEVBR|nr:hypothetical protein GH714_002197 [Hevea brasiliensis]
MNRALLPEMLHIAATASGFQGDLGEVVTRSVKPDPSLMDNGWSDLVGFGPCGYGNYNGSGFDVNCAISSTSSCPPAVVAPATNAKVLAEGREPVLSEKLNSGVARECLKKRKVDKVQNSTKVRREKISERMKYLQDLVPGCNKITGKAGMLDEIINYVQSLQRQVEFLSMKLAAVNPRLDFNVDNLFAKEAFPACATNFPASGMSSDMTNHAYLQFNQVQQQQQQQLVTCCGLDVGINPPDMGLRRTISSPRSIPEMFLDSSCFTVKSYIRLHIQPSSTWDADLQNLYNVAFEQGTIEASNLLKMEM